MSKQHSTEGSIRLPPFSTVSEISARWFHGFDFMYALTTRVSSSHITKFGTSFLPCHKPINFYFVVQLADSALQIFDDLGCIMKDLSIRIELSGDRCTKMVESLNSIPLDHIPSISKANRSALLFATPAPSFTKKSMNRMVEETYGNCRTKPQLWKLQHHIGVDPKSYSDPGHFMRLWTGA